LTTIIWGLAIPNRSMALLYNWVSNLDGVLPESVFSERKFSVNVFYFLNGA
jgi:hypothetical protein